MMKLAGSLWGVRFQGVTREWYWTECSWEPACLLQGMGGSAQQELERSKEMGL